MRELHCGARMDGDTNMDEIQIRENWIEEKCTQCRYFKKREGRQRLDRCTNKEVTEGRYSKETLSGLYYCSEFATKDGDAE